MKDRAQRVLVVAARPEDEAYVFGATIATLVQRGTELIVLSCSNNATAAIEASPSTGSVPETVSHGAAVPSAVATSATTGSSAEANTAVADAEADAGAGADTGERAAVSVDEVVREILGITSHHILREDNGRQFSTLDARALASDLAAAITSLKPDVVVSYAKESSGTARGAEALLVHEAAVLATELAGVPFYTASAVPVDRGVAVSSATALAFKRRATEIYRNEVPVGESISTPPEYLRRLRRRELVIGERSRVERIILALVSLALGALVGLVLTAVHQSAFTIGDVRVPWGIVVSVTLVTALILGLRLIYDTRVAAGFASLGVLVMSAILAAAMPGGTILIPANVAGYVWTFAPVLVVLIVVGWPRVNRQVSPASRANIELNSPVKGADIS
ncbi:PIG-L family deacetylase [Salinibacterium sp. NSLL150]|uniref:PIG-L family deacetylase n=1 Tax=unclassified Salinibacterium TaxID=2632331 RepID=UPI0018CF9C78|nr:MULTISPECIES: PIG-L family deacetylase [unclassified Salinibacterium]MBH0099547.1 PIG-L family deacetylase [Salinibacterium sp. NSLL35]MBH0102301.1 PIG-L family deacetylase [Salinibacterium sp. NSLL150]MBH0105061.1 PIG-L family deacetylase [Salinibacterium sp. NSLL16]MBH0107821.1 PIG-L family deacetylase [Salinibacterium sp. NSLL17]